MDTTKGQPRWSTLFTIYDSIHFAMKHIGEWIGHSDMSTTANIYSHVDGASKAATAKVMEEALAE